MKKLKNAAVLLVVIAVAIVVCFFAACRKEKKDVGTVPSPAVTFFTRSSDPRIAQVNLGDGSLVDFLATKDASANMVALTGLTVHNADFSDAAVIELQNDLIKHISLSDGSQLTVNSITNGVYNVTVSTGDGAYQLNTDLKQASVSQPAVAVNALGTAPRGNVAIQRVDPPHALQVNSTVAAGMTGVKINLTKCGGIPADADAVTLTVRMKLSGNELTVMKTPAVHLATGLYLAGVPNGLANDDVVSGSSWCHFGADAIDQIEDEGAKGLYKVLAKLLLDAAGAVTVNSPVLSPKVSQTLQKFSEGLNKASSATDKLGMIKDNACDNAKFSDYKVNFGGLRIYAEAQAPNDGGTSFISQIQEVNAVGPYPDLNIDLGSFPTINKINLVPLQPGAGQSYTATAEMMCLPLNTQISISVLGTDGYSNGFTTTVTAATASDPFVISLKVPGGAGGVKDVITVNVKTPTKTLYPKTNYLIFGSGTNGQ